MFISDRDSSIISLSADAMVQMTEQLKIYEFDNIIVSGSASKSTSVDWLLVNIVFEGNMNTITNNSDLLYGIVYFKGTTYTSGKDQYLYGMLKLGNLSNTNFTITTNRNNSVIDVRLISSNDIISYTGGINRDGSLNSIYFRASLASPNADNPKKTDSKNYREKFRASNGYINKALD